VTDSSEAVRCREDGSWQLFGSNNLGIQQNITAKEIQKCAVLGPRQVLIFYELSEVARQVRHLKIRHKLTQIV